MKINIFNNPQSNYNFVLLIIKEVNLIDFNLYRQLFIGLTMWNLYSKLELYLFKYKG